MPACHVHDTCNYEVMYVTLYVLYQCMYSMYIEKTCNNVRNCNNVYYET